MNQSPAEQPTVPGLAAEQIERMRRDEQILSGTGISANYANDMYFYGRIEVLRVLHPEVRLKRFEYRTPEETAEHAASSVVWTREKVKEFLPNVRTYSEYIEQARQRSNLPLEIFVTEQNKERITRIDEKAAAMKALWRDNPDEIDLASLNRLAYEVSCLIYGEQKESELRKSFLELEGD